MKSTVYYIALLTLLLGLVSCGVFKNHNKVENPSSPEKTINVQQSTIYKGWWVYGELQHIFKDEATLEEWDIQFLNEEMEELKELYLAVCEMEYFPMECEMRGYVANGILYVTSFEILYIQGCGE